MAAGKEQLIFGMDMAGINKSLGQHWLKNRAILDEIAQLAGEGDLCYSASRREKLISSCKQEREISITSQERDI